MYSFSFVLGFVFLLVNPCLCKNLGDGDFMPYSMLQYSNRDPRVLKGCKFYNIPTVPVDTSNSLCFKINPQPEAVFYPSVQGPDIPGFAIMCDNVFILSLGDKYQSKTYFVSGYSRTAYIIHPGDASLNGNKPEAATSVHEKVKDMDAHVYQSRGGCNEYDSSAVVDIRLEYSCDRVFFSVLRFSSIASDATLSTEETSLRPSVLKKLNSKNKN